MLTDKQEKPLNTETKKTCISEPIFAPVQLVSILGIIFPCFPQNASGYLLRAQSNFYIKCSRFFTLLWSITKMKQSAKIITTSLLLVTAINAKAITLSFDPDSTEVQVGDQLSLDILYDLVGEKTVGGAFSVKFDDNAFDFMSVEFAADLPDDPAFRVKPDAVDSNAFNLGFGNFNEITGSGIAATVTFKANKEGNFSFDLGAPLAGGDPFQNVSSINYSSAQVQVNANVVPLPGAVWLLLSGFAGLGVLKKKRA